MALKEGLERGDDESAAPSQGDGGISNDLDQHMKESHPKRKVQATKQPGFSEPLKINSSKETQVHSDNEKKKKNLE